MRVTDSTGGGASLSNLTRAARTAAEVGDKVASVSYSGVTSGSVNKGPTFGASARCSFGPRVTRPTCSPETETMTSPSWARRPGRTPSRRSRTAARWSTSRLRDGCPNHERQWRVQQRERHELRLPHGRRVQALIWSRNPNPAPQQVEDVLRMSCDDLRSWDRQPVRLRSDQLRRRHADDRDVGGVLPRCAPRRGEPGGRRRARRDRHRNRRAGHRGRGSGSTPVRASCPSFVLRRVAFRAVRRLPAPPRSATTSSSPRGGDMAFAPASGAAAAGRGRGAGHRPRGRLEAASG